MAHIAAIPASFVPGVGGPLSKALDGVGAAGDALGAAGKGLADSRITDATFNQRQDALNQQRYGNDLAGARLNLTAPSERAHTSVQGDILANAKPFAFTGGTHMVGNIPVPDASGGLSPDLFSANTRALGTKMSADALADSSRLPNGGAIGAAPRLTPLPQAGAMDTILNTAGTIGNFADILKRYQGAQKPVGMASNADPNDQNGWG